MRNYNGSHSSSFIDHPPSSKSSHHHSNTHARGSQRSDDGFSVQDLKEEYTKALGYIDKLKAEQNNLKHTLKMTLDNKVETPSTAGFSSKSFLSSQSTKSKSSKELEKQLFELEMENSELRSQLDSTTSKIGKLQREKQALQEKVYASENQGSNKKELMGEIRGLTQEIKVLTSKLQELEEENKRLSKQKERNYEKNPQKPSSSLIRYVNYVSKLVSSLSRSSFARTCYEERFPKSIEILDILETGQFESVLLKSYKYITDLLINLNSITNEDETPRVSDALARRSSAQNSRTNVDESVRRQPSQDGNDQSSRINALEESDGLPSTLRSPKIRDEFASSKGSKVALKNIVNPPEGAYNTYKTSSRGQHSKTYSTIIPTNSRAYDSYILEDGKKENIQREARHMASGASYMDDEYSRSTNSTHQKRRGHNESQSVKVEEEIPRVKLIKEEQFYRGGDYEDEEEDYSRSYKEYKEQRDPRERGNNRQERQERQERGERRREEREPKAEEEEWDRREHNNNRRKEIREKEYVGERESRVEEEEWDRREHNNNRRKEIREREYVGDQEDMYEQERGAPPVYRERQERRERLDKEDEERQGRYKQRGKLEVSVQKSPVEYGYRSRSVPENQEIAEEEGETGETGRKEENMKNREENYNEEEEEGDEKQQMWNKKRNELERMSRRMSAQNSICSDKGKGFSTFKVSFGRTESKNKKSMSPVNHIMDVPRKKRLDISTSKFDPITGVDAKNLSGSQTAKAGESNSTARFLEIEGRVQESFTKHGRGGSMKSLLQMDKLNGSEVEN